MKREKDKQPPSLISGRDAACHAVCQVFERHAFVAPELRRLSTSGRISKSEAALAMEIALGSIRHLLTIEPLLKTVARFDPSRVSPILRAVLYTAAYQIVWMDRIPDFAAVNEAVAIARGVQHRAAGMVNAILRQLTRAIEQPRADWERSNPRHIRINWEHACVFREPMLPGADGLAIATGLGRKLLKSWTDCVGAERAEAAAWASQAVPPIVLNRNSLRIDAGGFIEQVRRAYGDHVSCTNDVAVLPSTADLGETALFRDGLAHVQDHTARAAALLVNAQPDERILDLCAAPGGKTITLAQQMKNRGVLVACDRSELRLARLSDNVRRLQLSCVRPSLIDQTSGEALEAEEPFDAALVDVPCSNTGVLSRRPEARLRYARSRVAELPEIQGQLLRRAARHVRPGGRLVYSTCSVQPAENSEVVQGFIDQHSDWRLDEQWTAWPAWGPDLVDAQDGGYAARLIRSQNQ